jgi:TonB family protein
MKGGLASLSNREREMLGLLGRGHEAKSIASALGLSVHTVNERLRAARRKLGVSSSREAARLLLAHEAGAEPSNKFGHNKIGVAFAREKEPHPVGANSTATGARRALVYAVIGIVMVGSLVSILMTLTAGGNGANAPSAGPRPAQAIVTLPSLFTPADYPAEALAQTTQGGSGYRLKVNAAGRVEQCDIERSSGSAALDEATCRVVTTRARFKPALNAAGQPVASSFTGTIQWMVREGT